MRPPLGGIIYALFCTSRHISTGPSSSLAAVAGGAVIVTDLGGEQAAQLVAAIALATGVLFLLLALFRMGWIAQFLSKAVITGFLAGAAIDVVVGELPKLTGTTAEGDSAWREFATWLGSLGDADWDNRARRRDRSRRDPRPAAFRAEGSGRARARRRRTDRLGPVRPRRARGGARGRGAERAARSRAARSRACGGPLRDDRHRGRGPSADRVLPDCGRRPGIRCATSLPHRREPGVRGVRGWRTWAPASSRECPSRRASRPAR